MERLRLFIALELPTQVKDRLLELQGRLKACGADVRWTRPEGIHLTLKFLGDTDPSAVDSLAEGLGRAASESPCFTLEASGAGAFPNLRRPRVLWAGVKGDLDALGALQGRVEREAASLGYEPEKRGFSPHLTLGRVRSPKNQQRLIDALAKEAYVELGRIEADRLILFQSELRPSGAVYTALRVLSLA